MSNHCNNPNAPFNVRIVIPTFDPNKEEEEPIPGIPSNPPTVGRVIVRGIPPIKVEERKEGLDTVFIVSYSPSSPPSARISASPNSVEIGIPVSITYAYGDTEGSSPIVERTLTPTEAISNSKQFTKSFTFMQAGTQGVYTYSVKDEEAQTASAQAGVNVLYRFFKGTIIRGNDSLDLPTILSMQSALGSSIGGAFSRQAYTMDKSPQGHFVWVYPADFGSIPTPTGDGNFPFQLVDLPGTWVHNGITYKAAKTSTYFTTGGSATLGF